jgi:hypothetical protein
MEFWIYLKLPLMQLILLGTLATVAGANFNNQFAATTLGVPSPRPSPVGNGSTTGAR